MSYIEVALLALLAAEFVVQRQRAVQTTNPSNTSTNNNNEESIERRYDWNNNNLNAISANPPETTATTTTTTLHRHLFQQPLAQYPRLQTSSASTIAIDNNSIRALQQSSIGSNGDYNSNNRISNNNTSNYNSQQLQQQQQQQQLHGTSDDNIISDSSTPDAEGCTNISQNRHVDYLNIVSYIITSILVLSAMILHVGGSEEGVLGNRYLWMEYQVRGM